MKRNFVAALVFIGTLTAYGQQPAVQKFPDAKPAVAAPAKQPSPAEKKPEPAVGPVTPEQVKDLHDSLSVFQLDQLAVETARNTFAQNDPVAKKALDILNSAIAADPGVKKAAEQQEADRKLLLDKIDKLRKQQHLDNNWDWDFNANKFVQKSPAAVAQPSKQG